MENGIKKFLGKRIKIVFHDGEGVAVREGVLEHIDDLGVFVNINGKTEMIFKNNLVRMEGLE